MLVLCLFFMLWVTQKTITLQLQVEDLLAPQAKPAAQDESAVPAPKGNPQPCRMTTVEGALRAPEPRCQHLSPPQAEEVPFNGPMLLEHCNGFEHVSNMLSITLCSPTPQP
jgi:hypothetical protein